MYFDTHSHLCLCEAHIPIDAHIEEAKAAGVQFILDPGLHPQDYVERKEKLGHHTHVLLGVAAAPHAKEKITDADLSLLETILKEENVAALSEIGLEYFHFPAEKDRQAQRALLKKQLKLALKYDLPIFLHIRDAFEDALAILKEHAIKKAAVHCFTGNTQQAKAFLDQGYFLSFSGIVTFKNAKEVREAALYCPLDKMLTETDAPYLAPVPMRGNKNKTPFLIHTNTFIAAQKDMDLDAFNHRVFQNALAFINVPAELLN